MHGGENDGRENAVERREALENVRAVRNRPENVPLNERTQNLGKAERRNGKIIALQTQARLADEPRERRRDKSRGNDAQRGGQREAERSAVKILVDARPARRRDGQNSVGISAEQHKARLAKGEKPREAVEKIETHRQQRIDGRFLDHGREHGIMRLFIDEDQKHENHGSQCKREDPIPFSIFRLCHGITLSHFVLLRTYPWA